MIIDWTYGAMAHLQGYFTGHYVSTETTVVLVVSGRVSVDFTVAGPGITFSAK